jgi:hypothetical protein
MVAEYELTPVYLALHLLELMLECIENLVEDGYVMLKALLPLLKPFYLSLKLGYPVI